MALATHLSALAGGALRGAVGPGTPGLPVPVVSPRARRMRIFGDGYCLLVVCVVGFVVFGGLIVLGLFMIGSLALAWLTGG